MDITIKVRGEFDNVATRMVVTSGDKGEWLRQLRQAVKALEAEITALERCPHHNKMDD